MYTYKEASLCLVFVFPPTKADNHSNRKPFLTFDVCKKKYIQNSRVKKRNGIRNIYNLIWLNTTMKDDGNDHFSFHAHHFTYSHFIRTNKNFHFNSVAHF